MKASNTHQDVSFYLAQRMENQELINLKLNVLFTHNQLGACLHVNIYLKFIFYFFFQNTPTHLSMDNAKTAVGKSSDG